MNPLLNKFRMFQTRSIYLPGWRFARCIYNSTIHAQVTAFTAAKLRHACQEQILCGIDIAVVNRAAFRARPPSDIEPHLVHDVLALAARLAGREPSIHHDHGTAVPFGLVLDHAAEFSETRVSDMPRQRRVFNHAFHVQIFDTDYLVLAHKSGRERVHGVTALVRHSTMSAGDTKPLFLSALAALHPSRMAPLLLLEILESLGELARICNFLAAAERRQMRQPKVHADHRGRHRQQGDLDHGGERDVVAPVGLALERDGVWTSHGGKFLCQLHRTELGQADSAAYPLRFRDILKPERNRIIITRPEARIARGFIARLHVPKEMGKGGVLIAQRLRQAGGRWLGEPSELRKRLEFGEATGDIHAGNGLFAPLIGFGAGIKRPIPQPAGSAVPLIQHANLSAIGIGASTERPLNGRHARIIAHAGPQRIQCAKRTPDEPGVKSNPME